MPPEVNRHCRKPQGPIGMVREEGHGYVIVCGYARIFTDLSTENRDGVYRRQGCL